MRLCFIRIVMLLCWGAFVELPLAQGADIHVTKQGDSVVDERAHTLDGGRYGQSINGKAFQQDAIVTHRGYQYLAYYDAERHVALARRKLPDGAWEIVRFADYDFRGNDAHNTISLGICPGDGTIHLAFDHHNEPLHYRRSKPGVASDPATTKWEAALFGPVTSELEAGQPIRITYPRFLQTPEGDLQLIYRRDSSGNGDRMMVDYDASESRWKNTRQIDSRAGRYSDSFYKESTSRCSYPNGYHYGPDGKLHVTWVWRETGSEPNHDLMYAYSEDGGVHWLNSNDQPLDRPIGLDTPGITVARISRGYGLLNTHGQAIDSQGQIHTVMSHCSDESLRASGIEPGAERWGPDAARRYHHYWRDGKGMWHHQELSGAAGGRVKLFFDQSDNAYLIFNDNPRLKSPNSKPGNLVIVASSPEKQWTDWRAIHVEKGPFVNEMLADYYRWQDENILSVIVQETPESAHEATRLRVVDYRLEP